MRFHDSEKSDQKLCCASSSASSRFQTFEKAATSNFVQNSAVAKGNAKHFRMMTTLFLARLRFILASISNFRIGLSQSCTSAWSLDSAGVSGRPPHPQTDPKEFVEFTRSRNKGYAKHFLRFQAHHQQTRFEY